MNRDDIIRMAREADLCPWVVVVPENEAKRLERFAALVAAATVVRFKPRPDKDGGYELQCVQCWSNATDEVEDGAIRARGEK